MIPKTLHVIWVGDESRRPDNCIQTWIDLNPEWHVRVWGNQDLVETEWINARHMREMSSRELNGVADLMRWEILYNEGGFVVDADSICRRPLEDWLLEGDAFACWENEIDRPKLIAAGYVASVPENPFFGQIIKDLHSEETVMQGMAWQTVGPLRLTQSYYRYRYGGLTIWPSHFFIPEHFAGQSYDGRGIVFASQEWASTRGTYDTLYKKELS
ncbi:glycosyltransferase family 32 protein [Aquabacterium sp.]|uniref:glycosyltransferase family 32 protein n=1 Tax=Aquabacterium sp. TaxID=1872578 RepID=UPI0035AE5245